MGFLLGKINESLQEFETTDQDSSPDDGAISDRSINMSAVAYQFKEKYSWKYEFMHMDNTEFQNLLYLIKNRNSLHEGMLLTPIPYSHYPTYTSLLPTSGSTNKCYLGQISSIFPWNVAYADLVKTEISSGDYGKIRVNDTNYIYLDEEPSYLNYYLLEFDLSNFISTFGYKELRRLTIAMMGMNSSPYRFFIWSPLNNDWYLIDDRYYQDSSAFDLPSGDGTFSLNKGLVSSFSIPWGTDSIKVDFLDSSNIVRFMICGNSVSQSIMIQYIRLLVNGYWVKTDKAPKFENFSTSFTGAGRSGNLYLTEL